MCLLFQVGLGKTGKVPGPSSINLTPSCDEAERTIQAGRAQESSEWHGRGVEAAGSTTP